MPNYMGTEIPVLETLLDLTLHVSSFGCSFLLLIIRFIIEYTDIKKVSLSLSPALINN